MYQKLCGIFAARFTQTVVCPLALLSAVYNARLTQNLHMIGQGGLPNFHLVNQYASAFLTTAEQFQDSKSFFIAERLEYFGVFFVGIFQALSPQIKLFWYEQYMRKIKKSQYQRIFFYESKNSFTLYIRELDK